jgi:replicative DNA helicase
MNARLKPPRARLLPPHDLEIEENTIGVALLGYPLPDWLEERHFWASQHRFIFHHIQELGDKANLPSVAALIRDRGKVERPYSPNPVTSVELVKMMDGAEFALRMGWAVEFERLQELAERRELQAAAERALIVLGQGGSAAEAREMLKAAFEP